MLTKWSYRTLCLHLMREGFINAKMEEEGCLLSVITTLEATEYKGGGFEKVCSGGRRRVSGESCC